MLRVMFVVLCWSCVAAASSALAEDAARAFPGFVCRATPLFPPLARGDERGVAVRNFGICTSGTSPREAQVDCADHDLSTIFPVFNLMHGFAAACQPVLSFDGERILFSGKRKADEPLNIWEVGVRDGHQRRITQEQVDCHSPIYLSSTYTLDADKPVHQIAFWKVPAGEQFGAIHTCRLDGTRVRRITFNPRGATDPLHLSDGRLLFSSWNAPRSTGQPDGTVLMTVNTDGTDVFIFACADEPPAIRRPLCETGDGWVVYVESRLDRPDGGSILAAVRRMRSLRTRRVIGEEWAGFIRSAMPLSDGNLLVSHRPPHSTTDNLFRVNPADEKRTPVPPDTVLEFLVNTAAAAGYSPPSSDRIQIPLRGEPVGHSSVVDEQVDTGRLYCLNAYLSDTAESVRVGSGAIKRVRVIQAASTTIAVGPVREEVLGQANVESDGSFFLEVPARRPLRFETLDANGKILQSMQSWAWVMPNERRGCIGCHEDRELSPPNRHVFALRKRPHRLLGTGSRTGKGMVDMTLRDPGDGAQ